MTVNNYPMATVVSGPSNPTGTSSTSLVMMGLDVAFTPESTGSVWITVVGQLVNSTAGKGVQGNIKTGTGTAPVNGAANTGTSRGVSTAWSDVPSTSIPFILEGFATGLTLGTAYWCDLAVEAISSGTATVSGVWVYLIEAAW